MADTWPNERQLRPELRPEGLGPERVRPQARPDGLGLVPGEAQDAATLAQALPLDETTLIGLFSGPDGGTALLRLPGGDIVKVAAGGYAAGGQVTAIDDNSLRLQRGGREYILTMPS